MSYDVRAYYNEADDCDGFEIFNTEFPSDSGIVYTVNHWRDKPHIAFDTHIKITTLDELLSFNTALSKLCQKARNEL